MAKDETGQDVRAGEAGEMQEVVNTQAKQNAARVYHHIRVRQGEEEFDLLLTDAELERARRRAEKNPEDLPQQQLGWFKSLFR